MLLHCGGLGVFWIGADPQRPHSSILRSDFRVGASRYIQFNLQRRAQRHQRAGPTCGAIICEYQSPSQNPSSTRRLRYHPQNVDLPTILTKKKKPYPIPIKELKKIGRENKELERSGIEQPLEPPKNGLLVPDLVPVAHNVLDAWKILIRGVSQLLQVIPVYACSDCSAVHVAEIGHEIRDCLGPTNGRRYYFHSWVKASVSDILVPIESYHMYDPFGPRIDHDDRFGYDRIPAIMELCIQAGVDIPEYPSRRRTEPVRMIGRKVIHRGGSVTDPRPYSHGNSSVLVDLDPCGASNHAAPLQSEVPGIAQETMDAFEVVRSGLTKLMNKYAVKACGYCSEVHVGTWGHRVKLCGAHKHQWRDGKHGWQHATVDEVFPPSYVWHVRDPKGPPLLNKLKRYYGKTPAVVEICKQAAAEIPDIYKRMMRLDIIIPDSVELDLVA